MDAAAPEREEPTPEELRLPGPPWILGARGAPLEAPENTLVGLRRALELGLDGFACELRACSGGDPVAFADARLERTTDGEGLVSERGLPELFGLDAGGWYSKAHQGAGVPHLDEVLELESELGAAPRRLFLVRDPRLVPELARRAGDLAAARSTCFLARGRETVLALRDADLRAGLLVDVACEEDRRFVRDERIEVVATETPRGWMCEAGDEDWSAERWALDVDDARTLHELFDRGVAGVTTREPRRALALRTLLGLTPTAPEAYPLDVPPLFVDAASAESGGEWSGHWEPHVHVANPFEHPVRVALDLFVRRGAYEVEGLPRRFDLEPGETQRVAFRVRGGSWSPGGDPVVAALYAWDAGCLLLDAELSRERRVVASALAQRVELLRESPGQRQASMTVRRRGRELTVTVENAGGLVGARAVVHLDGRTWTGARSVRARLPEGFDDLREGLAFSCGLVGQAHEGGPEVLRRWAGGLPAEGDHGAPGRLCAR